MDEVKGMGIMMKRMLTLIFGFLTLAFVSTFAPIASQQTAQIPEPDLSAFPLPIVKVSLKEVANYPIDPLLTNFKSLKQHIDTTVLLVGEHIFFANDKTVYRLTNGVKRTLVFDAPLYKVITDWKTRVFVMTKTRWVYIYDLNSLKRLSSFQVKYAQNPSEFAYLSDDVLLIGFDLWRDEARKNRNPVAAAAYGMSGVERWKIANTAKIFSDSDERHFFELLQVGQRSFVANCCSYPVQKNTYEQNVKTAFLYENKTGKLRVAEIETPDSVLTVPSYTNVDNPDLFTYHDFTTLDMYNYRNLPKAILDISDDKLSTIVPRCDFIGAENRRLIYKNYFIFSVFSRCGGSIGFFDRKSKNLLNYAKSEICMYKSLDYGRGYDIALINNINGKFFIDPFTLSIAKINLDMKIELKCVFKSPKDSSKFISTKLWYEYQIHPRVFSDNSTSIVIGESQPITLGLSENSKEILCYDKYLYMLKEKLAIGFSDGKLRYYEVIK